MYDHGPLHTQVGRNTYANNEGSGYTPRPLLKQSQKKRWRPLSNEG